MNKPSELSIVITGGAGFVGSALALALRNTFPSAKISAFDNLRRRGSENALTELKAEKIEFIHGDVRSREDIEELPAYDLLIDCSAEPSVHAGVNGSPTSVIENNLVGTMRILESVRRHQAAILFLSTSRVYPVELLNSLPYEISPERFLWPETIEQQGFSKHGISEEFPLSGRRTFYGFTKLASEQLITEYVHHYGIRALINRCGVISGPGQHGKVDQGFVALWVESHRQHRPLQYIGYGGKGQQVRDVLHVDDLSELILLQLESLDNWSGEIFNVGGGFENTVSLRELTTICEEVTGNSISITPHPQTADVDIPIYYTNNSAVSKRYKWLPRRSPLQVVNDIMLWHNNRNSVTGS
ncbi:NAD-dependent epimerase/dehydratase family protein [Calycomorphotria hydatis]|uniref:CDP-paratose 2-epimerase n=1 Tax=Calycomorphotria hydatis TaxID=2528027 RepID=A0A517TEC5_9PLAN|nr:NAD-dependent epimerase/dehydratase family protein [Calycomorphotria hydatis]QDT66728.1 CDP-paratose 2-epimerase [Calycomorphotria hydatis]